MPKDIAFPFEQNATGDVEAVTGTEFYERHALQLGLLAADDASGGGATANDIIELESSIRKLLENSPYFDGPVVVDVIDSDDETLSAEIDVRNISNFEIELEEPDI
jgi:hypothetical protein